MVQYFLTSMSTTRPNKHPRLKSATVIPFRFCWLQYGPEKHSFWLIFNVLFIYDDFQMTRIKGKFF